MIKQTQTATRKKKKIIAADKMLNNYFQVLFKKIPHLDNNEDNRHFIFWLIGFFNRKGSFSITNRKPFFCLEHKEDPELIQLIAEKLKAGKINKNSCIENENRLRLRFSFYSQKDFSLLISILNGFIFETEKLQKFSECLNAFNLKTKQQIPLEKPKISSFNLPQFSQAVFQGFIEAGHSPFGYNYNRRIFTFFPYITIFAKNNPFLINIFKKQLSEKKEKERITAIARGRKHFEIHFKHRYPKESSIFFEGFQSQSAATRAPAINKVIQSLNANKFYGKTKKSFQEFLTLNREIKSTEILKKSEKKKTFNNILEKVTQFLREHKPDKISKAKKYSLFYTETTQKKPIGLY